eukprot:2992473-Pleurochrysis_carterae.AAC.1
MPLLRCGLTFLPSCTPTSSHAVCLFAAPHRALALLLRCVSVLVRIRSAACGCANPTLLGCAPLPRATAGSLARSPLGPTAPSHPRSRVLLPRVRSLLFLWEGSRKPTFAAIALLACSTAFSRALAAFIRCACLVVRALAPLYVPFHFLLRAFPRWIFYEKYPDEHRVDLILYLQLQGLAGCSA